MGKHAGVEPLSHTIPRDSILNSIKEQLFDEKVSVVAIQGMGGIGKTTLAGLIARLSEIMEKFVNGIYWIRIGQQKTNIDEFILEKQGQLLGMVEKGHQIPSEISKGCDSLKNIFKEMNSLIILDDVWDKDILKGFDFIGNDCPNTKLLITSRIKDISKLSEKSVKEIEVNELLNEEPTRLLWNICPKQDKFNSIQEFQNNEVIKQIISNSYGHPLTLAIFGSVLFQDNIDVEDWNKIFKKEDVKEHMDNVIPSLNYEITLFKALDLSINHLKEEDRRIFLSLSLFSTPSSCISVIPFEILQRLWKTEDTLKKCLMIYT